MDQRDFEKVLLLIFQNEIVEAEGMVVIEHSKYTKLDHIPNYSFQKNYGGSVFSFFEIEKQDVK